MFQVNENLLYSLNASVAASLYFTCTPISTFWVLQYLVPVYWSEACHWKDWITQGMRLHDYLGTTLVTLQGLNQNILLQQKYTKTHECKRGRSRCKIFCICLLPRAVHCGDIHAALLTFSMKWKGSDASGAFGGAFSFQRWTAMHYWLQNTPAMLFHLSSTADCGCTSSALVFLLGCAPFWLASLLLV